jgi:hypothetical protein
MAEAVIKRASDKKPLANKKRKRGTRECGCPEVNFLSEKPLTDKTESGELEFGFGAKVLLTMRFSISEQSEV